MRCYHDVIALMEMLDPKGHQSRLQDAVVVHHGPSGPDSSGGGRQPDVLEEGVWRPSGGASVQAERPVLDGRANKRLDDCGSERHRHVGPPQVPRWGNRRPVLQIHGSRRLPLYLHVAQVQEPVPLTPAAVQRTLSTSLYGAVEGHPRRQFCPI